MKVSLDTLPNCMATPSSPTCINWKFFTLASLTRPPKFRHQHCSSSCQWGGTFFSTILLSLAGLEVLAGRSASSSSSGSFLAASGCRLARSCLWEDIPTWLHCVLPWPAALEAAGSASVACADGLPPITGNCTLSLRGPLNPKKLRRYFMLPTSSFPLRRSARRSPLTAHDPLACGQLISSEYLVQSRLVFSVAMVSPCSLAASCSTHMRMLKRSFPGFERCDAARRNFSWRSCSGSPRYM
mmetsp:Transcript_17663/g.44827  ORF Transcript_17663/g.44827 Transcript_17663/m.44827 type:complete len:241 (-) Transcript_17663:777-1499(-)